MLGSLLARSPPGAPLTPGMDSVRDRVEHRHQDHGMSILARRSPPLISLTRCSARSASRFSEGLMYLFKVTC
jgi:hypothetical protein